MTDPDQTRTRIHAVLENTDQALYLGFRVSDELDPYSPVNLGHVTALLRDGSDLLDIHSGVTVYLEAEGGPARRFRLHRSGAGTDPVLTELPARSR